MVDRTVHPDEINLNSNATDTYVSPPPATDPPNLLAALALADLGFSVFPLCHPTHNGPHSPTHVKTCQRFGKHPVVRWKLLQSIPLTPAQLRSWWKRNPLFNLGVVCGKVSGIVMVDIDTPHGESVWEQITQGACPPTWEYGTGRGGRHLIFGCEPSIPLTPNPFPGLRGHLDFLGEGKQSVVPPSLHISGVCYGWTVGGPGSGLDIAPMPQGLTDKLVSAAQQDRRPGVGERPAVLPSDADAHQVRRARAYLRKCQGSVSGQGGHGQAFKIADRLVNGFGLEGDIALSLLKEDWNERCSPPWSDAELRHKLADALSKGEGRPIPERPRSQEKRRTVEPEKGGAIRDVVRGVTVPTPISVAASEVSAKTVEYLWPGWIPRGSLTIVDGKKGMGKSTLLVAVAADVTGGPRLPGDDQKRRKLGPALWLAGEEDIGVSTRPRLEVAGADLVQVRFLGVDADGCQVKRIQLPEHLPLLEEEIKRTGAVLLVIDPWVSLLASGLNANSEQDVRLVLEPLQNLASRTRCAIVMTRHLKKGGNGPAIDQGLGSTAIGNVARTVLLVSRDPDHREGRILAPVACNLGTEPSPLAFRLVGPAGAGRIMWGSEVATDADQLVGEGEDPGDRGARLEARRLLRLAIGEGWRAATEVRAEAEKAGISPRTLTRAKAELGVRSERRGGVGAQGFWEWGPPEGGWPAE